MEPRQITATELVDSPTDSIEGPVEIDGFLMYRGTDDQAWLSADNQTVAPVVTLDSPKEIRAALRSKVSALGGSEILYANRAKVVGTLTSGQNGYQLTNIKTLEVWDEDEILHLSLDHC